MDLETLILSEVSQTEKDKYHMTSLIYEIQKNNTHELIYKTETETYRLRKQTYGCRGEGQLGTLERSCTHCYIKMDNQQKPTV